MQQVDFFQTHPIRISSLPIGIVCCSDGSVGFIPLAQFKSIFESYEEYSAYYSLENFNVNGSTFEYNTRYKYKEIPTLLVWLKAQNMLMPEGA